MGTLRTGLLPVVDVFRALVGPSGLDLRPTSTQIIQRTWSGGLRGSGIYSDPVLLSKVWGARHVTQREIAGSGGRFEQGDVLIGPITPQYTTALGATLGFTQPQLVPIVNTQGVENIYRLTSQSGATGINGDYQLIELRRDKALHFQMIVRRVRTTPGPPL